MRTGVWDRNSGVRERERENVGWVGPGRIAIDRRDLRPSVRPTVKFGYLSRACDTIDKGVSLSMTGWPGGRACRWADAEGGGGT